MKKINTTYLIALSTLVFASCSESDGLSSGIPLSKEKIAFAATLQDGWNGGTSAEAGNNSRAGKPTFSGLAMEQKVLTANEGLAKPLYLHPLETENTSVMNAMPQTRGVMNESSTVGSFGVSAVYSKDNSFLFQNEEATQNGNYWFTSSNATWPLDGSVSFYAYAPYNETSLSLQGSDDVVKNKTIRYTANTDDFSKQPDLIVAKNENNAFTSSTANKAVGLSFSHALTAITFSISADMIPGTVKSITVSGVYGQGDYDFSNAPWPSTSLANPSTYVITLNDASVKAGESKALTDKNSALMMIPQDLDANANAKVSMVFNDGNKDKTVSFSLNGTWDAGKHITYVLSSSKITTLNMGSLTYPTGWNSVNDGATYKIRTAYASNTSAGLYVVNEDRKIIAANVQLTYNGTSWSLPAGSKLKFSPKYSYFVYYPYQKTSLAGLPAVNTTVSDVSSSTQFFADAIATWKSSKLAADQSTPEKLNACDLQIGKASLDEDGCSASFKMEHAMGLAILNRESKSLDHFYKLKGYEDYTWSNGSVPTTANGTISGLNLFSTTATQGIMVVAPNSTTTFTNTSTSSKDEWINKNVPITINEGNKVYSVEAKLKLQHYDETTYTMEVGDIYYSDGAITKPGDISAARTNGKTPIGVIGYIGNNKWTESGTGSGYGGHALVLCLKNIGSNGTTDMGARYRWYSLDTDCGRFKVDTGDKIRGSSDKDYGSGYKETTDLVAKGSAFEAANAAKNYKTLPANSSKCTGWFLPTAGQYYAVMSQLGGGIRPDTWEPYEFFGNMKTVSGKITAALSKVGADQYTEFFQGTNTWVWTSSEFSSKLVVYIDSGVDESKESGSVRISLDYRTSRNPVRPFLAF